MVPLRMRLRAWGVLALAGGLAIVAIDLQKINGQTAAATATSGFEVASIRPHAGEDDHQETSLLPGGRYVGTNATVRKLIRLALGVEDEQILGAPGWIDKEHYDIDAKTGSTAKLQPPEFQRGLLALLEDRFQFRFHRETRERAVYWLVVPKGGMKLKEVGATEEASMSTNANGTRKLLEARAISMKDLAGVLSRQTRRQVEDHTGLAGRFDVKLEWDDSPEADAQMPSIFTAAQEQLGLKLNAAKGEVGVIVVDGVERPSAN
ncbi:MAG TPA: TIGR03435 family protein [Acidobacteriaceae bacterium]|nr:TIGR03435 family protein [Acidobacteriaceae bacterium]